MTRPGPDDDTRSAAEVAGDLERELDAWADRLPGPVVAECRRILHGWLHDAPEITEYLVRRTERALRREVDDSGPR